MAQPDIKQEPLSPTDRILPSCSQDGEMEEVKCWMFFFIEKSVFLPVVNIPNETNLSLFTACTRQNFLFLRIVWQISEESPHSMK